jgi:ribose 5-phosphate isomerase B
MAKESSMKMMIGCDHGGYDLKQVVVKRLQQLDHQVEDIGAFSGEAVDYPGYAVQVAQAVAEARVDRGILICGSGIGMCITANRIPGVRAALVSEPYAAKLSRRHNDSNILCLGGRLLGDQLALEIVDVWLREEFEGGRHERRVALIDRLSADSAAKTASTRL